MFEEVLLAVHVTFKNSSDKYVLKKKKKSPMRFSFDEVLFLIFLDELRRFLISSFIYLQGLSASMLMYIHHTHICIKLVETSLPDEAVSHSCIVVVSPITRPRFFFLIITPCHCQSVDAVF